MLASQESCSVIDAKKWRFTRDMIADAPAHPGIFALWKDGELLRLGVARGRETIRAKLIAYLEATRGIATHYSWEITPSPVQRAREIVSRLERLQ